MQTVIKRFLIILLVAFAGYWGVERLVAFADGHYAQREEMARQIGEKKAEEIEDTTEADRPVRVKSFHNQPGSAGAGAQ